MPKSAEEAVEEAAQSLDDSASSDEDVETASTQEEDPDGHDTATGDEDPEQLTDGEEEPGPIPFSRHKSVLDKSYQERDQARQEAEQIRQQLQALEWAQKYQPQEVQRYSQIVDFMQRDPLGFSEYLNREIEGNPHLRAQMESKAQPKFPEPDLRAEDGREAYSAEATRQLAEMMVQQAVAKSQAEMGTQYQQLQAVVAELQKQSTDAEMNRVAADYTSGLMEELGALPGLTENQDAIGEAFAKIPQEVIMRDGIKACALSAYLSVVTPTNEKKAQEKAKETMRKKAAAATVNPGGGKQESSKRPKNEKELEAHLEQISKGA